jgi:cytochrome c
MRASTITSAVLLAFGVWGATATSSGLEFNDDAPQAAAAMPAGDPVRGKTVYEASCGGCHSLDANRIGPAHRGVVGRAAGTAVNYAYSAGVKSSGVTWTPEILDKWLTNPGAFIKGTKMGFRLADPQKRADVIAYLAAEGGK